MLDLKNGEIILCQSGFRINRKTTPEDLEKNIPDLIIDALTLRVDIIGIIAGWIQSQVGFLEQAFVLRIKSD